MSVGLGTVSSPVVDGRCTGCGRFIKRTESHFHSPPRKFRGRPKVHIWADGGAMVSRCDDIERARELAMAKYRDMSGDPDETEALFPPGSGIVERGRCVVGPYAGEYDWAWYPLPNDARGPGITTAVVWYW